MKAGTQIWCHCLVPNHVHNVVVPADESGLARAFGDTHRRYTAFANSQAHICGGAASTRWRWTERI